VTKPRKNLLPSPNPVWEHPLRHVIRTLCTVHGKLEMPWQWITSLGEPKCVRCGKKLNPKEVEAMVPYGTRVSIGACTKCRRTVLNSAKKSVAEIAKDWKAGRGVPQEATVWANNRPLATAVIAAVGLVGTDVLEPFPEYVPLVVCPKNRSHGWSRQDVCPKCGSQLREVSDE